MRPSNIKQEKLWESFTWDIKPGEFVSNNMTFSLNGVPCWRVTKIEKHPTKNKWRVGHAEPISHFENVKL